MALMGKTRRTIGLTFGLLLSACLDEPRLKADTEANFTASFAAVTRHLGNAEDEKLDSALRDIVLVQGSLYGPLFDAKNYRLPSGEPGAALGQGLTNALADSMTKAIELGVTSKWNENRAKAVVQNAWAIVDGRTAKEILAIAKNERKMAAESALAIYRDQLAKAKMALNDIQTEADISARNQAEQKSLIERIEITKPRFTFEKSGFTEQPTISFTIANKGTIPVKRIFVHGQVQTPGRAIPWVEADFNYTFPGGLEPRETKELSLSPNMFSDWGKVPREAVRGAVLSLNLMALEDAAEKRFGEDTSDRDRMDLRKKALEDGIRTLEGKINDLEMQVRQGG